MKEFWEVKPKAFQGKQREEPLFVRENGVPLRRVEVQRLLELSALSQGMDATKMGSHSLRIGGATAMYHSTGDLEVVKRYGRWASDAFHGYIWESSEGQQGLARGMATTEHELTVV